MARYGCNGANAAEQARTLYNSRQPKTSPVLSAHRLGAPVDAFAIVLNTDNHFIAASLYANQRLSGSCVLDDVVEPLLHDPVNAGLRRRRKQAVNAVEL